MSDKKTITYRTYFFPGSFFAEEESSVVPSRSVKAAVKDAPKNAFAFQFHDQAKIVVDGETLSGGAKNRSPRYYLGGKTYTLKDVEEQYPNEKILISNMRGNGWKLLVKTRVGNWQPLEGKDVVVSA